MRTAWRIGRADVSGGAAWAIVDTQVAAIGQSVQILPVCSSGQHGISAAIDDISVIPAGMPAGIAAGAAAGATASPATMAIASNRVMSKRKSIPCFSHGDRGMWKGRRFTLAAKSDAG